MFHSFGNTRAVIMHQPVSSAHANIHNATVEPHCILIRVHFLTRRQTKSLTANGTTYWCAVSVCVCDCTREVCISEGPQVSGSTSILRSYANHFVSVCTFECQEICCDGKKDHRGDLFKMLFALLKLIFT